ncbi:pyridoxine 5'-phosphate synthase [candidate division KSB1 bacterium]|nr:pyridoxine 5'-phosphate synthase [candidate division KSB1 bacterium]
MARLCLCVNQIAFLRTMYRQKEPDPVAVAVAAEMAGIDGIMVQLHEDRFDINDRDLSLLKELVKTHLNLAIPLSDEMVKKAIHLLPDMVTLLPQASKEAPQVAVHSLDVEASLEYLEDITAALRANNIVVSVLAAPDAQQIRAAARAGVDYIQLNTANLSTLEDLSSLMEQIERLRTVAVAANKLGLGVAAGRGLSYQIIREIGAIPIIEEVNVGKAILSRAFLIGLDRAIQSMKALI